MGRGRGEETQQAEQTAGRGALQTYASKRGIRDTRPSPRRWTWLAPPRAGAHRSGGDAVPRGDRGQDLPVDPALVPAAPTALVAALVAPAVHAGHRRTAGRREPGFPAARGRPGMLRRRAGRCSPRCSSR
ncbi:hypothetical protein NKH77_15615 [Streptomyces sp. M19]